MNDESIEDESAENKSIKVEKLAAESIKNESAVSSINPDEGSNKIYDSNYEYDDESITDDRSIKGIIEYTNNCNSNCIKANNKYVTLDTIMSPILVPNESQTSMDNQEAYDESDDNSISNDYDSDCCSEASSTCSSIITVAYPILKILNNFHLSHLTSNSMAVTATDYQLKIKFKNEDTFVIIIIYFSRIVYACVKISILLNDSEVKSIYSMALKNTISRLILLYILPDLDLIGTIKLWEVESGVSKYDISVEDYKDISDISKIDHDVIDHSLDGASLFMRSVQLRVKKLNQYCVICGRNLQIDVPVFIYCNNDLCKDKFHRSGSFGIKELVDDDWLVADIKLNIYYNFVVPQGPAGYRAKLNLHTHIIEILLGHIDKDINAGDPAIEKQLIEKISNILNNCGSVHNLSDINDRGEILLISWILSSYHLANQKDQDMESNDLCFHIHSGDYNKFVENQRTDNSQSITVYHGSKPYAWANIFQNGLMNMSGTEYMTTGESYGSGIYTATERSMSEGFNSPFLKDRRGSLYPLMNKRIMMECTLNNHTNNNVATKHNNTIVVKKKQYLMANKIYVY
jgi:hypothetical protein